MRILIVEDETTLLEQLAQHLKSEGFAVDCAADGEEGLYYGREYEYDAAIIDLGLPKLDGIDLITRLRSEERGFPILVLTARGLVIRSMPSSFGRPRSMIAASYSYSRP